MSSLHRVLATVAFSTIGSCIILALYSWVADLPMPPAAWLITALCPILVSTPVAVVLIRQGERVRRLNDDLLAAYAQLNRVASTDDLTGVANRRAFLESAVAARRGGEDWLLLADIDRFKSINDRFGHERGDAFLKAVAEVLRDAAGPRDVVGRLGGEEFAMFLRGVSASEAQRKAEAVRVRTAALALPTEDRRTVATTLSIGLARCAIGETIHDDLKRADQALYQAKRDGRDRVRLFADPRQGSRQPGEPLAIAS